MLEIINNVRRSEMPENSLAKQKNELVRNGFIQAAKVIILHEGVDSVTVRKVAQDSGYSYATIYHYFDDLNALLLAAKESMVKDVAAHFSTGDRTPFQSVADLKRSNRAYVQYYLDRQNVYHFFYSYRFENAATPNYELEFQDGWVFAYQTFVRNGLLKPQDVIITAKTVIYAIQGLLALYFSSNGPTQEKLFQDMDDIADYLLHERSKL